MSAPTRPAFLSSLEALFGLTLDPAMRRRVTAYLQLWSRWNPRIDLTGPMSADQLLANHVFEGLWAAKTFLAGVRRVADLASGAGLPGLAIQLYRPDLDITLIEARQKRAVFLKEAAHRMGLAAQVFAGRGEDFAWEGIEVVSLRAWRPPAALFERLASRGCWVLWFHGGEVVEGGAYRDLLSRRVPGSRQRRVSLLADTGSSP